MQQAGLRLVILIAAVHRKKKVLSLFPASLCYCSSRNDTFERGERCPVCAVDWAAWHIWVSTWMLTLASFVCLLRSWEMFMQQQQQQQGTELDTAEDLSVHSSLITQEECCWCNIFAFERKKVQGSECEMCLCRTLCFETSGLTLITRETLKFSSAACAFK